MSSAPLSGGSNRVQALDRTVADIFIGSHWHWDHIGNASRFPTTVELVVGPNFKENFMPGYPTKKDALLLDSDFE